MSESPPNYNERNPDVQTSLEKIKENIEKNEIEMDKAVKSGDREKFDETCDQHGVYSEQYNLQKNADNNPF